MTAVLNWTYNLSKKSTPNIPTPVPSTPVREGEEDDDESDESEEHENEQMDTEDEESDDEDVYTAERIVKSRKRKNIQEYLVKWEGYPDDQNTWEPEQNIHDKDLIKEFESKRRGR